MSNKIVLLLICLLFLSIAACTVAEAAILPAVQAAPILATRVENTADPRTITVVGEGEVSLEPDIATINIGAEARASTVAEAKTEVETIMAAIAEALDWMNVADRDIQTSHYVIHFEREPRLMVAENTVSENKEAYYVSNVVRVTIRDVEKAGDVLDAAVQAGANQVYGVTYTVADKNAWRSLAQAQGMVDARVRAQELANLAGVELGDVMSISEIIGGMPVSVLVGERSMGGGGIVPGELEFSTQLQVTFRIR